LLHRPTAQHTCSFRHQLNKYSLSLSLSAKTWPPRRRHHFSPALCAQDDHRLTLTQFPLLAAARPRRQYEPTAPPRAHRSRTPAAEIALVRRCSSHPSHLFLHWVGHFGGFCSVPCRIGASTAHCSSF